MSSFMWDRETPRAKCLEHGDDTEIIGLGNGGDPCSIDGCEEMLWAVIHVCSSCTRSYTVWEYEARCSSDEVVIGHQMKERVTFTCQCGNVYQTFPEPGEW